METLAPITALLIAAGTIFSAIYQTKNKSLETLEKHIQKLDKDIEEMKREHEASEKRWNEKEAEWKDKYSELLKLYQKEKTRSDRFERRIRALTKG